MMTTSAHRTRTRHNDSDRARHARLPLDESSSLETLHDVIDGRCGDQKVPLDVRFGWGPAESVDVFRDESEILALTGRRPSPERTCSPPACRRKVQGQFAADRLDDERGAIFEVNIDMCVVARFDGGQALSQQHASNFLDIQRRLLPRCDPVAGPSSLDSRKRPRLRRCLVPAITPDRGKSACQAANRQRRHARHLCSQRQKDVRDVRVDVLVEGHARARPCAVRCRGLSGRNLFV
jgi:hypothetical protein